jgi:hypothetical protein
LLITVTDFQQNLSALTTLCKTDCQLLHVSKSLYTIRLEHAAFWLNSFTISTCEKPKASSFCNSKRLESVSTLGHPLKLQLFFNFKTAITFLESLKHPKLDSAN